MIGFLGRSTSSSAMKVLVDRKASYEYRVVLNDNGNANNFSSPSSSNDTTSLLFQGGDIAVFVQQNWCVAATTTTSPSRSSSVTARSLSETILIPKEESTIRGFQDGLGAYTGTRIVWSCKTTKRKKNDNNTNQEKEEGEEEEIIPIVTSFQNFESGNAVVFEIEWPNGAQQTNISSSTDGTLATFPSFRMAGKNGTAVSETLPSAISWQGSFVQSVHGYSVGPRGGPTVFYDASDSTLSNVIIGSPFHGGNENHGGGDGDGDGDGDDDDAHWKTFTAGNKQDWKGLPAFSPGTSARISSLPKGFRQSYLLYQGNGGITSTMAEWGDVMKKSRPSKGNKLKDITLDNIGYQTDNGAMYCFCQDKNCSRTLINEIDSLADLSTPMGYLSFQGAGTSTGRGQAAPWCVETWGVDGGLDRRHYPIDVIPFQQALGIPLQLYAPYFCPTTSYFKNNKNTSQSSSNWTSVMSDPSLPGCKGFTFKNVAPQESRGFYDWFLDKGLRAGMTSFESDFMNQNFNCIPDFIQSASNADTWLSGMANAALARNVSIQWCYATPSDVLASLDFPAVTNFRVSFDFCYGRSWDIGESSLLVWALGAAPSKDTLWTTDNKKTAIPGCPWTPDHEAPAAELHLVLALMSTGPVGISDAIGFTNSTILKRAIREDGVLLKPTRAITAVDSSFVKSSAGGRLGVGGYLYGSSGVGPSWILVSFMTTETLAVSINDLWPPLKSQSSLLAYRQFTDGSRCINGEGVDVNDCVRVISVKESIKHMEILVEPSSLHSSPGSEFVPTITHIWQSCEEGGWFFLGELSKYVPLSPARFLDVTCHALGVAATITGKIGEIVELTALRPRHPSSAGTIRHEVVEEKVQIPESKKMRVLFSSAHGGKSVLGKVPVLE